MNFIHVNKNVAQISCSEVCFFFKQIAHKSIIWWNDGYVNYHCQINEIDLGEWIINSTLIIESSVRNAKPVVAGLFYKLS